MGSEAYGDLIHHWIGGIFIPGATVDSLTALMANYRAYKDIYKPAIVDSKLLSCSGTEQTFWILSQHKALFITAAMEGHYRTHHIRIDSRHGYSVSDIPSMMRWLVNPIVNRLSVSSMITTRQQTRDGVQSMQRSQAASEW